MNYSNKTIIYPVGNRRFSFGALSVGVLAMALLVSYIVLAWTAPGASPPEGNVPAPINVGSTAQTKTGDLTLANLYLNATAAEGNIYRIDQLIGYNDLRLKGKSDETAPIYYGASAHHFYTAGSERLTILNDGKVGIGPTSPGYKLDVAGDINIGSSNVYRRGGTAGSGLSCSSGQVIKGTTVSGGIITGGSCASDDTGGGISCSDCDSRFVNQSGDTMSGNLFFSGGTRYTGTSDNNSFIVRTNNSDRLTITSAGNVGIGTTSPGEKLQVGDNTTQVALVVVPQSDKVHLATKSGATTFYNFLLTPGAVKVAGNLDILGNYNLDVSGTSYLGCAWVYATGESSCTNYNGARNCSVSGAGDWIYAECPTGKMAMAGGCGSSVESNLAESTPEAGTYYSWFCDWKGNSGTMRVDILCCRIGD